MKSQDQKPKSKLIPELVPVDYESGLILFATVMSRLKNQSLLLVSEDCYLYDAFHPRNDGDIDLYDDALTVDKCLGHCRSLRGTAVTYAAITNGTRCSCTSRPIDVTLEYYSSVCNSECPGQTNSQRLCGGYRTYEDISGNRYEDHFWTIYVLWCTNH